MQELEEWNWKERFYRYHIFYHYLRGYTINEKRRCFGEFEECLRLLNVRVLEPYLRQLAKLGFSTQKHDLLR